MTSDYDDQIFDLIDCAQYLLSNIQPSEWAEKNRRMTTDVSPIPGPYRFKYTPYIREILDTISSNHPGSKFAIMKGAQVGFSTGLLENAIGYIISESPGNILFLTGHSDLAEEAMSGKIDQMIDSCGLRDLLGSKSLRKKNQRTGDTNKSKEFPGGSLVAGSAGNHKLLRQRSVRYGFIDDFDAARKKTKESGTTTEMIEQRFAAYADKMKLYYISTPEVKQTSNIEPVFLLGDQRKYFVPCPCCGDYIIFVWSIVVENQTAGITWEIDEKGKLIDSSVGYTCQSCFGFFTDKHKYKMNLLGEWRPTAEPSEVGYYSYHLSSLYAPPGMYSWTHYVRQYLKANPQNEPQKIAEMQTFTNLVLGETFEEQGEAPKSTNLQKNTRDFEIGSIPEKMSENDGNGRIVLITCAADLNGKVDDARLDYEIVAWSESGPSYSIDHGSIGTFIPNQTQVQKDKTDRLKWTYRMGEPNNVWDEFKKVIDKTYTTDTDRNMKIFITGIDTGNTYMGQAYSFVESTKGSGLNVVGIKGKDEFAYRRVGLDTPIFKKGRERSDLYIVEVNQVKDDVAERMKLRWDPTGDNPQPTDFMNFPTPSGGKYTFRRYFAHFEAEQRILDRDNNGDGVKFIWKKVTPTAQNHLYDCRIYNIALREITVSVLCKELKVKNPSWKDFMDAFFKNK